MAGALIHEAVFGDILGEAISAYKKHGVLTDEPVRACAIMVREAGEALNEALLMTSPKLSRFDNKQKYIDALYTELAQVAATAAMIMTTIREENELGKAGA